MSGFGNHYTINSAVFPLLSASGIPASKQNPKFDRFLKLYFHDCFLGIRVVYCYCIEI